MKYLFILFFIYGCKITHNHSDTTYNAKIYHVSYTHRFPANLASSKVFQVADKKLDVSGDTAKAIHYKYSQFNFLPSSKTELKDTLFDFRTAVIIYENKLALDTLYFGKKKFIVNKDKRLTNDRDFENYILELVKERYF